ncbi:hypothetical protein C8Q76DRAFT_179794 [Earliella scabrosa]|nr:hypothetical protein C8Q76DRAFT_179794 [Earliella scabrosa]
MRGLEATRVYTRIFAANALLILRAPPGLRRIQLRFQRWGPYEPHAIGDLRNVDAVDARPPWRRLDVEIVRRFPGLEAVVCVIAGSQWDFEPDEGRGAQTQALGEVDAQTRREEYDAYVGFLTRVFPQLHERGLLRFEMAA